MLTKQAEAKALYSMALHDLERHCGLGLSDHTCISWECCQELYFFETVLEHRMRSLMTCEGDYRCSPLSRSGLGRSR